MKTCLPNDIYKSIADTAGIESQESFVFITTDQLATLLAVKFRSEGDYFAVSRIVLHRLLTTGLEDIIHYGHRYDRMETLESGKIRVYFKNGESTEGDILVAADGVNSAIRKQLMPKSFEPTKFGIGGIVGKVFVDTLDAVNIDQIKQGICIVTSANGRGIFVAPQMYSADAKDKITKLFLGEVDGVTHEAQLSPNAAGESLLLIGGDDKNKLIDNARDYVFYGYLTKYPEQDVGINAEGSMKEVSQQDLVDAVVKQIEDNKWAPSLVDLVKKTDVNTVGYWPLHVAPKITSLSKYKSSNVTFVGDSIHASTSSFRSILIIVPPTGGEGGNTAIRDAASLVKHLAKVASAADPKATLDVEIQEYEKDMLKFSSSSISRSYRNSTVITVEGYIYPYLVRGLLRIVNFFFGVKTAT